MLDRPSSVGRAARLRFVPALLAAALLAAGGATPGAAALQEAGPDDPPPCSPGAEAAGAPSADLYCMELTPAPAVRRAAGTVELGRIPSPFSVATTEDGRLRHRPVMHLRGLPEPSTLGDGFTTYVAWVAPPRMFPVRKLGEVDNGTHRLPEVDLNKFVVLVSAETSAEVEERRGRLVLRGRSPSTRMEPPDVLEFAFGTMRGGDPDTAGAPGETPSAGAPATPGGGGRWTRPPMPEGLSTLPAMMDLEPPEVTPYLPSADDPSGVPFARPRELARVSDGDTLSLEAGLVRRRIGGRTLLMYGFNEQYPGPLIQTQRDAEIVVEFTNRTEWPATIHWHGVRLDNRFDGVPDVTQEPVEPGGAFTYRVRFPDAGIYWYHPHVREDVLQDLGLYGNLMVRSPRPDHYAPVNREEFVMLDDLLVGEDGLIPFGRERATHALMGRFGNVYLVNGEPDYDLEVDRGSVVRFFLTNVSNTRTFNLSFGGAPMKVVGSDIGNFEREAWVESVVIAPAERYVIHVRFPEEGSVPLVNRVQGVDHLYGAFRPERDTLGTVRVSGRAVEESHAGGFETLREHRWVAEEIDPYREHFDRPPDHELTLTMRHRDLPFVVERLMRFDSTYFNPVEWSGTMPMMNWASTTRQVDWVLRDPGTGRENMAIDWSFEVGEVVKIRLRNERRVFHAMQHPIHIHGQRFLILSRDGMPNDNLVWKDTILLPAGGTAEILLELSNPGRWMAHCHISEHLEAGMRTVFTVHPPQEPKGDDR